MKRLLTITALFCAILPTNAIIWHYGNFNSSKKQCAVTKWSGTQPTSGKLTIPTTYTHTDGITYTVVEIASHALDNLTTVSEITIPASISKIGEAKEGTYPSSSRNFSNFPALKKFIVKSGNKSFNAISNMLYIGDDYLLAVPQKLAVTGGELTVPSTTTAVSNTAFAENTTVTTLTLPRRCNINDNGGLNLATAIKTYKLNGSGNVLQIFDGMLVDYGTRLISFPPAKSASTVSIPASVTNIEDYAFAYTDGVKRVNLSTVKNIGKRAFYRSGLTSISIPVTVEELRSNTFEKSLSLRSIHIESVEPAIPDHFALDCSALTSVTSANTISSVDDAAFKNCKSLTDFPFSGHTNLSGDSIFYNCGFSKVVFNSDATHGGLSNSGQHLFSRCNALEIIDASAVSGTEEEPFTLGPNYATGCMRLTTLKLPPVTSFWKYGNDNTPAFGYTCTLSHIVAGTMWILDSCPQFCYSSLNGVQSFSPKVYIAVTANSRFLPDSYNTWPTGDMFVGGNGAKVTPQIFCDAYTPSQNYICPGASYIVPGGTLHNYSKAVEKGCTVKPGYTIAISRSEGYMRVTLGATSSNVAEVTGFKVSFNNGESVNIGIYGDAVSTCSYDSVTEVRVSYNVDGVEMCTDYPSEHWLGASVDNVTTDSNDITITGRHINGGAGCVSISVYNVTGTEVWHEQAAETTLDSLAAGIYMALIKYDGGKTLTIKFILK